MWSGGAPRWKSPRATFDEKGFFYVPSMSSRVIIYKGLLLAPQISDFYKELADPLTKSSLCMVHQRFSTNTFPTWQLAHPYRMICHNGEINTVRGNVELDERARERAAIGRYSATTFRKFSR